jgi:hypothetical protein
MIHRIKGQKDDEPEAIWELSKNCFTHIIQLTVAYGHDSAVILKARGNGRIMFNKKALEVLFGIKVDVIGD